MPFSPLSAELLFQAQTETQRINYGDAFCGTEKDPQEVRT